MWQPQVLGCSKQGHGDVIWVRGLVSGDVVGGGGWVGP